MKPKALVLKAAGSNCDLETKNAADQAGFQSEIWLAGDLVAKPKNLHKFQFLIIPGGFSYGDDLGGGKIFANEIKFKLLPEIQNFLKDGKLILGICNGFQVLVKCGLLPDPVAAKQTVTLTLNTSGKFEARWVYLKVCSQKSEFLKEERIIELPVAHGEGKFVPLDNAVMNRLEKEGQVVLKYVTESGEIDGYPYNPNGSVNSVAGICDKTGRVLGLMPHPERFQDVYQYPTWTLRKPDEPYGMIFFKNAHKYSRENL